MHAETSWFLSEETQRKRAVAYYRHSAEDKQENSVSIQRELIHAFASEHSIDIIHEEADEGETGLLAERDGFQRLLNEWVLNEKTPSFEYVLVRDVDRWARFQNPNEWGYYEFLCNKKGKRVIDVSLGFPREDRPLATNVLILIKREMAAEYSRQLSDKVFHGCVYVSRQGFSAGGPPCYGMERMLLDSSKRSLRILKSGEHKHIANERVTFVPAEDGTAEVVCEIFAMLVREALSPTQIADVLNRRSIPSAKGGLWNRAKVLRILRNETYTGSRIYNKTWNRLRQGRRDNPRSEWVICENAFPSVVEKELFRSAQKRLEQLLQRGESEIDLRACHTKNLVKRRVSGLLERRGFGRDVYCLLPVLTSTAIPQGKGTRKWCFVLPPLLTHCSTVLGVSITVDCSDPIGDIFALPRADFGVGGVLLFSEDSKAFGRYCVQKEEVEEAVLALAGREK